jgi:5,10-methenyltetrahydromethanopterin hydrogenase
MEHHPVEKVEEKVAELAGEAERGKSARTPLIVLGGVNLVVFAVVAIVLALVFTVYLIA